ncbi:acyl-CoA dehydrogenase family protein [Kribbella soli]
MRRSSPGLHGRSSRGIGHPVRPALPTAGRRPGVRRTLLGGNGILLEHDVGRYVADAEAIYSYEGTREMNTLIVGKSITGHSAFI